MWGGLGTSVEKGYLYCRTRPKHTVDSLDGGETTAQAACRHIEGDWYLYGYYDP